MSEGIFQNKIIKNIRAEGFHAQKFHDDASIGIPDLFVGTPKMGFWLELKYKRFPSKKSTPFNPELSGAQEDWLQEYDHMPNPTAIIMATNKGWIVVPQVFIHKVLFDNPANNYKHLLITKPPAMNLIKYSYESVRVHEMNPNKVAFIGR